MTSRRARIKGIANIPARRKNDVSTADIGVNLEPKTPEKNALLPDNGTEEAPASSKENDQTEADKDVKQLSSASGTERNSIKTEISSQNNSRITNVNDPSNISNHKSEVTVTLDNSNKEIEVFRTADRKVQCTDVASKGEPQSESVNSQCEVPGESCTQPDVDEKTKEGPRFARRWVPRPAVKIPAVARRPKPSEPQPKDANQNIENEAPVAPESDVISPVAPETVTPPRAEPATGPLGITKLPSTPELSIKIPTDSDRTLPSPLSPSKTLNRARIRPSPKLIRRNSVQGSASESEDDGRRSRSRIRNDSVCSAASYTAESNPAKDKLSVIQDRLNASCKVHKLFRRSEQTRKVAEARREFFQKFGTTIPDKKRLTMMDLIYYNPTSNPMPKREAKNSNESEVVETMEEENAAEEMEDDPEETNGSEDMTPVPQVKVGPNGEIILDEQSLVIEQTGAKKGREKLANSQIVNIDDLDRAYGIYKRPQRAKDWNVVDTLRFYKTLNTVGTDFSLMLSLFPGRTRRELKMKFKKEEKVNRALIDKALMNPVEFDFAELEQQLVADELALAADRKEKSKRRPKVPRQKKRKSASVLSSEMDEESQAERAPLKAAVPRKKFKDAYSVLENGLEDILQPLSDTDDEDILPTDKSARQSRPPRACVRKSKYTDGEDSEAEPAEQQDDTNNNDAIVGDQALHGGGVAEVVDRSENKNEIVEENGLDEPMAEDNANEDSEPTSQGSGTAENEESRRTDIAAKETNQLVPKGNEQNCAVPNILPNDLSTVEPGSLMILSTLAPDGQQIFKVFMVTPGQTKVPVNLSPDVVQSLTTSLGTAETVTLDLPVIGGGDKPVPLDTDTAVPT